MRLKAIIRGRTLWQLREITVGNGFNQSPLEAHFGLGNATNIETIRIEWPSGTVQELHNINPRQFLTITEPPRLTATQVNGLPEFFLKSGRGLPYDIEVSTDLTVWSVIATVTVTNLNGAAPIRDSALPVTQHK